MMATQWSWGLSTLSCVRSTRESTCLAVAAGQTTATRVRSTRRTRRTNGAKDRKSEHRQRQSESLAVKAL